MHLCLFEDRPEQLEPLSFTRPVFDLRCGLSSLGDKILQTIDATSFSVWIRPDLVEVAKQEHPDWSINEPTRVSGQDVFWVNGRWIPPSGFVAPTSACIGKIDRQIVFAYVPAERMRSWEGETPAEWLRLQNDLPTFEAEGFLVEFPWDLVDRNGAQIGIDFDQQGWARRPCQIASGLSLVGPRDRLWLHPSARVEPLVVADTSNGPVVVDEQASISAFTRLEGPCYIGPRSQVLGAKIRAGSTIGPECRIGGEVEASIVQGHTNKYHDGFLGHAYLGEWINLGAGTQNSDLRNDYGEVKVILNGLPMRTGKNKVGCILGDHTKTGLGTLFNTGASAGVFCQLLPSGGFVPKYLPSFTSWWNGSLQEAFTFDQLITTAEIAMKRRGKTLTDAYRTLYAKLYDDSAMERQRVLREMEIRKMRRSA